MYENKTLEELLAILAEKDAKIAELDADIVVLNEMLADKEKKVQSVDYPNGLWEIDGKKYTGVGATVRHQGRIIPTKDVALDFVKKSVASKQNLFKEVA
jgi:hypothetical protein